MIHPHTELRLISPSKGYGVFATKTIPAGTLTWVLDPLDRRLSTEEMAALPPAAKEALNTYAFNNADGSAVLCWDFGRFLNHSCDPSCICMGVVCDIAARTILPGEQLTCEYGLLNGEERFDCHCGAPACRGKIDRAGFEATAKNVDKQVSDLVPAISLVPQPLLTHMLPEERRRLDRILAGHEPIPSCLENFP